MPVVKPSAPWNEELQGLRGQYKSSRLKDCTHTSIIIFFFEPEIGAIPTFALRSRARTDPFRLHSRLHGSANGYASMGTDLLITLYLLRSIGSLEQFGTRSRSSYERACWIGDFRFVFVFMFSCLYTKLKKQYSTANTVLLLPLTTKNSTVLLLPNQHKNKQ